jgi:transposase
LGSADREVCHGATVLAAGRGVVAHRPAPAAGRPGKPRVDDRRVISGILHVLKTGCRWRDVPAEYGPATTVYNRWSQRGVWQRLFERVAASGEVPTELLLDSSHVKAHRSAAGGKGGRSGARAAAARPRSTSWPMVAADRSPSRRRLEMWPTSPWRRACSAPSPRPGASSRRQGL